MLDNDFSLSEGETSDLEGVGISLYLVNPNTVLSLSSVVAPVLPSSDVILFHFMNSEKDASMKDSSLIVSVVLAS